MGETYPAITQNAQIQPSSPCPCCYSNLSSDLAYPVRACPARAAQPAGSHLSATLRSWTGASASHRCSGPPQSQVQPQLFLKEKWVGNKQVAESSLPASRILAYVQVCEASNILLPDGPASSPLNQEHHSAWLQRALEVATVGLFLGKCLALAVSLTWDLKRLLKGKQRSWHCGLASKAAVCDGSIPYGLQFEARMLHFQFRSLLTTWEKQW